MEELLELMMSPLEWISSSIECFMACAIFSVILCLIMSCIMMMVIAN